MESFDTRNPSSFDGSAQTSFSKLNRCFYLLEVLFSFLAGFIFKPGRAGLTLTFFPNKLCFRGPYFLMLIGSCCALRPVPPGSWPWFPRLWSWFPFLPKIWISNLHFKIAFQNCISKLLFNIAFQNCISKLHFKIAFQKYNSNLHFNIANQHAFQNCISNLPFKIAFQIFIFKFAIRN